MSGTNQSEIEAAAERWRRFFCGEMSTLERDEYYHSALLDEDRDALCQLSVDRLAADRAERSRLIDEAWCKENGGEEIDEGTWRWKFASIVVDWDAENGVAVNVDDKHWSFLYAVENCSAMRKLLVSLKCIQE